eukprot:359151-Amphidinium_carterae.4
MHAEVQLPSWVLVAHAHMQVAKELPWVRQHVLRSTLVGQQHPLEIPTRCAEATRWCRKGKLSSRNTRWRWWRHASSKNVSDWSIVHWDGGDWQGQCGGSPATRGGGRRDAVRSVT